MAKDRARLIAILTLSKPISCRLLVIEVVAVGEEHVVPILEQPNLSGSVGLDELPEILTEPRGVIDVSGIASRLELRVWRVKPNRLGLLW
jgi:hypothetical protein